MPDLVTTADSALDQITRVIVERYDPERVLLFGSRARGDARADSDYDVMIVMDTRTALEPAFNPTARPHSLSWGDPNWPAWRLAGLRASRRWRPVHWRSRT